MNIEPVEVLITVSFGEALLDDLKEISPRLRIHFQPARRVEDIPADLWSRVEVLYTDRVLPTASQAPNLRWIQFHYAGIDSVLDAPVLQKPELVITSLSGAAAPQMAEFAVTLMLAMGHRLPEMMAYQSRAEWPRDRFQRFQPVELRGSTVGLVGYGSIGREIARMLQPLKVQILAIKRDVMHPEDTGYMPDGMGDPEGSFFQRLYPMQALRSMLKECDFVVVAIPLNAQTKGLITVDDLKAMKPTAFLIDIGRGGIIDPAGLLSVLQDRKIAGAAIDVFSEEPLAPTSPFWKLPNVIISPHIGGSSLYYNDRAELLFAENLKRYLTGSALLNRFDPQKGY
ncbi:MAG TPA: D-2-hydroxyacid dehydrogenase [Anaerolineaceae bacterium]